MEENLMVAAREPGDEKRAYTRPRSAACINAAAMTCTMIIVLTSIQSGSGAWWPYPIVAAVCTENQRACENWLTLLTQCLGCVMYIKANMAYCTRVLFDD
jgi:hypothetical protein